MSSNHRKQAQSVNTSTRKARSARLRIVRYDCMLAIPLIAVPDVTGGAMRRSEMSLSPSALGQPCCEAGAAGLTSSFGLKY
jgi:hypothetical protein